MDINHGESKLFLHQAMHNKRNGEVLVTSLRVIFTPSDAGPHPITMLTWTNIQKVDFAPSLTAIKIMTVQGKPEIISITGGATDDERVAEYQRMRTIITSIMEISPLLTAARQSLPQSNQAIAKVYKGLVVDGKIISEEEFWNTHRDALFDEVSKQISTTKQGMMNDIWKDIVHKVSDKKENTKEKLIFSRPEQKEIIFQLFPHVRIAFERKVPSHHNEEEFWDKFIEAGYHKGRKRRFGRPDQLFSPFISEAKDIVTSFVERPKARQRFDEGTIGTPEIDLTATYDSTYRECLHDEDRFCMIDHTTNDRLGLITFKEFQESVALAQNLSVNKNGSSRTECEELKRSKPLTYIPVNMTCQQRRNSDGIVRDNYKPKFDCKALATSLESGYLSLNRVNIEETFRTQQELRANELFINEMKQSKDLESTSLNSKQVRVDELPQSLNRVSLSVSSLSLSIVNGNL